ncbi:unnamed protein product [Coffea canephora]|uniref:Uncharacterized protein n=1 Tax=Coffea canephora TaxID=49390 RepID=A0A068V7A8_COFCA|nr:unnamed protein product [Coffea canephora]
MRVDYFFIINSNSHKVVPYLICYIIIYSFTASPSPAPAPAASRANINGLSPCGSDISSPFLQQHLQQGRRLLKHFQSKIQGMTSMFTIKSNCMMKWLLWLEKIWPPGLLQNHLSM